MAEKFIPLSTPNMCGNEEKYASEAIRNNWLSGGKYIRQFELDLAHYLKIEDVCAVGSGTSAIHLVLQKAGVRINDIVMVPALTFIASVNPIRYLMADPLFMDCDDSLCMDPIKLEAYLKQHAMVKDHVCIHKTTNQVIRALIVVHIFGNYADVEAIEKICRTYHITVIEDAAEALGTMNLQTNKMAGTIGSFGILSFNGNKIMTTGNGGALMCRDSKHTQELRHLSTQAKSDEVRFFHDAVGYNYRLPNVNAAIGVAQLESIEKFIEKKHALYDYYQEKLQPLGLRLLDFRENTRPNKWFFSLIWENHRMDREGLMEHLSQNDIQSRPIWGLINQQVPYKDCLSDQLTCSEYYYERVLNLPCSTDLTFEDIDYIVSKIQEVL